MRRFLLLGLLVGLLATVLAPVSAQARRHRDSGWVAGVVRDAAGHGLSDVEVRFYPASFRSGDDVESEVESTWTQWDGSWSVDVNAEWGLPPGTYLVKFHDWSGDRPERWYRNAASPEKAIPLSVTTSSTRDGVDVTLPEPVPPGIVKGRVRGNGARLEGVTVAAYTESSNGSGDPVATTATAAKGRYSLPLQPGRYRLVADATSYGLREQWWNASASFDSATTIVVIGETVVRHVSFDLSQQITFPQKPKGAFRKPKAPFDFTSLLVDRITEYQGQTRCRNRSRKGTRALRDLLFATYGETEGAGLNRACGSDTSEHYDGRAIDWMVNSRDPDQAAKGDSFTWWATKYRGKEPGVMARRLGIMYIIWRGRIWKQYQAQAGWQVYNSCDQAQYLKPSWDNDCHRNHVHISLTRPGSRMRTSWWTGTPR